MGQKTALGIHRWLFPKGLFLIVLGPDGVGKSTTIARLQFELEKLFGSCTSRRWRPGLIRKVTPDTGNRIPHAKVPRRPIASILSLLGLALDFSVGYLICVRPSMVRSEAVIFDRYFHDILIDPKRYRYAGPMWLPRILHRLILPRNPIFVVLDADEETILSRKQELPLPELKRQRAAYRAFTTRLPRSMVVRTDKPTADIVSEIVKNIKALHSCPSDEKLSSATVDHLTDATDELHNSNFASSKP
jgi:thymidylate kinase